jgi:hypothetical protein
MLASKISFSNNALSIYQRIKEKDNSEWRRGLTLPCKM